jgi:hypothetical protein
MSWVLSMKVAKGRDRIRWPRHSCQDLFSVDRMVLTGDALDMRLQWLYTLSSMMRGVRIALALLLLLAVGGLMPLAYASPPDPAWIRGIYDDADYDDVVDLVTSALAATAPVLLVDLRQTPPLVGPAPQLADDPVPTCSLSSLQSRAPPAA